MIPNPRGRTAIAARALLVALPLCWPACAKDSSSSAGPSGPSAPPTATLSVTFTDSPVPYRSSGCSFSTPQGWYTSARLRETAGVAFRPSTFTQRLDGAVNSVLSESFNSRFGACSDSSFADGSVAANGAVCGVVGVCTAGSFGSYQFEVSGTDANGHAVTFVSPTLQLAPK